ncbi:MAG: sugar MFS transporter [Cytophagales bacterium]
MNFISKRPIIVIGALFFIFGFVTWLNGALIPFFKIVCNLSNFESLLVAFCFYISYFIMALPSAWILQKTGFKNGMVLGLVIMAIGMLVFLPAAISRNYAVFLTGLFVIGTGLAVLQTAANPYVTVLGNVESAAQRISIMGVCSKAAGVASPILLGSIVFANANELMSTLPTLSFEQKEVLLNELSSKIIAPYAFMASTLAFLAFVVWKIDLPQIDLDQHTNDQEKSLNSKASIFQSPNLILGVVALFLYVGAEVIAGDTIINYAMTQGIGIDQASKFTSITLIAMLLGYFLGIFAIPKYMKQETFLLISAILGILFVLATLVFKGYVSVFCVAALGLANAIMWPAIWPLAIKDLGKFTKLGSSMLIMAIAGGALLPLAYGQIADSYSPQIGYSILLVCYGFILYYAIFGHKKLKW